MLMIKILKKMLGFNTRDKKMFSPFDSVQSLFNKNSLNSSEEKRLDIDNLLKQQKIYNNPEKLINFLNFILILMKG